MAVHLISPRTKKRSSSLKKPHRRLLENTELEDMRPRTTSLPTRNEINRPGRKYLTPISDQEYSVHPLRSFITTPKGLINRGDSMRSRSNSSVVSSCSGSTSELAPQSRSRTSSSVSNGSICIQSPVMPGSPLHGPPPLCGGEPHYRVTVLGCGGVGRRSLTQQFTTSQYLGGLDSPFSEGCDRELHVSVLLDGSETALEFIVPQENLDLHSVPTSDAIVLVFTIDDRSTFERTTDLLYELRKIDGWAGPVILVANKCDLVRTREVSTEEAKSVATTYDCKYIETSVVLNHNVDELLAGIVSQIRLADTTPKRGPEPGCYSRSKNLLHKIFRKDHLSKSCENLYVL
ncbi:unnamed protein product [Candidula unifasciata]|uniref:GTP-binding protein REM 1 n=1 Tax=Candidula unifasciata TaxID=100452 RepID=A0A8S3YJ03_9EUPU|nr:unnamed protein product [Candidula unifasciata]